ncbi:MAG: acyl-CoA thioesterase domain-containing protein [Actinomycetota bacterium]
MRIQDVDFTDLMALEPHGPDTFVGITARYPWGRIFGGQVLAQGLRAAAHTVREDVSVHSLHAYFIRPGTHREPVRYEVARLRDGRSFETRLVVARQSGGAILNLACSFQVEEEQADVQIVELPEDLPGPDDPSLDDTGWGAMLHRRALPTRKGWAAHWIRLDVDLGDDPVLQACALAFMSDAAPTSAARSSHPDSAGDRSDRELFMGASLDHAIWFHRPCRVDQWHYFDMDSHGLIGGRGLTTGNVLTADGTHIASVAQEVLLRRRRDES